MIYARLFRPTKSALRDFSHDVPGYVPRLEQRIPPSPRSLLDTLKLPSVRLAASYFFFFFLFFSRLKLYASSIVPEFYNIHGWKREEGRKKERKRKNIDNCYTTIVECERWWRNWSSFEKLVSITSENYIGGGTHEAA